MSYEKMSQQRVLHDEIHDDDIPPKVTQRDEVLTEDVL